MNIQTLRSRRTGITQTLIGSLSLASLLASAPPAVIAGPQETSGPETASAMVSFSDLDLTTPAGINAAQKRLVAAAQRLCHKFSDSLRASNYATSAACFSETLADATRSFNALLAAASAAGTEVARNTP